MAFDTTALDAACLDLGDDAIMMLDSGPVPISVIISNSQDLGSSDGYQVVTERTTGETTMEVVKGIRRNTVIIKDGVSYNVTGWQADTTGWVVIELEELP